MVKASQSQQYTSSGDEESELENESSSSDEEIHTSEDSDSDSEDEATTSEDSDSEPESALRAFIEDDLAHAHDDGEAYTDRDITPLSQASEEKQGSAHEIGPISTVRSSHDLQEAATMEANARNCVQIEDLGSNSADSCLPTSFSPHPFRPLVVSPSTERPHAESVLLHDDDSILFSPFYRPFPFRTPAPRVIAPASSHGSAVTFQSPNISPDADNCQASATHRSSEQFDTNSRAVAHSLQMAQDEKQSVRNGAYLSSSRSPRSAQWQQATQISCDDLFTFSPHFFPQRLVPGSSLSTRQAERIGDEPRAGLAQTFKPTNHTHFSSSMHAALPYEPDMSAPAPDTSDKLKANPRTVGEVDTCIDDSGDRALGDISSSLASLQDRATPTQLTARSSPASGRNKLIQGSRTRPTPLSPSLSLLPGLANNQNSCWLDSSVISIFAAACLDFEDLSSRFRSISTKSSLSLLWQILLEWHTKQDEQPPGLQTRLISRRRDDLRKALENEKPPVVSGGLSRENVFLWLGRLLKNHAEDDGYGEVQLYFQGYYAKLRVCQHPAPSQSSTPSPKALHYSVSERLHTRFYFTLTAQDYEAYAGDVSSWSKATFSLKAPSIPSTCRCRDEKESFQGQSSTSTLYVSIPVMLLIEVSPETPHYIADQWRFPKTVSLMSKTKNRVGVSYELVGRVLFSHIRGHYTGRFMRKLSTNRIQIVDHDGLAHEGSSRVLPGAKLESHLAGQHADLKDIYPGYHTAAVVYHLRGGIEAQKAFLSHRASEYSNKLKVAVAYTDIGLLNRAAVTFIRQGYNLLTPRSSKSRNSWLEYEGTTQPPKTCVEPAPSTDDMDIGDTVNEYDDAVPVDPSHISDVTNTAPVDDSLPVSCRCGVVGHGSHLLDGLKAVQCIECHSWSHIACQRDGRASEGTQMFICDSCAFSDMPVGRPAPKPKRRGGQKLPLSKRLTPGRGALVQIGTFWYPVRLLQAEEVLGERAWRVKLWRLCELGDQTFHPNKRVPETSLVDELWRDVAHRRRIRLGKWTHAATLPTEEDILANPSAVQFNSEVHAALSPHLDTLAALLDYHITNDDSPLGAQCIPALQEIKNRTAQSEAEKNGLLYDYGDLTIEDRAMIFNWIYHQVPQAPSYYHRWVGGVLPAHAATLLIASRMAEAPVATEDDDDQLGTDENPEDLKHRFRLQCAWLCQKTPSLATSRADVDRECIARLEERMFEESAAAGKAGMWQWGLDAGDHYKCWNPYLGLPLTWIHPDRPMTEDETIYEPGPNFIKERAPTPLVDTVQMNDRKRRAPRLKEKQGDLKRSRGAAGPKYSAI